MKKIVCLSTNPSGFTYEVAAFAARTDAQFITSGARTKEDVKAAVCDADVVLFSDITIDREVIDSFKNCKLIIRYGIGYDNVDTKYAAEKGIFVCNAPNYGVTDVAEHALSLLLSCAKRLTYMNDCVRDGMWDTSKMGASRRIAGKKVGFIGFGKIAKCVCQRTNAFGLKALVFDPFVSDAVAAEYSAEKVTLEQLLAQSDYVTLHLPLNEQTRHMMGATQFAQMKPDAVFINTSRGGLVNEKELIDALENGVIAGAGLDVFEDESGNIDPRILKMKQVTLTPHVAWNTIEGAAALHEEVTGNVIRFLEGNRPESIVNGL